MPPHRLVVTAPTCAETATLRLRVDVVFRALVHPDRATA